jgi:hypothetical protein
MRWAQYWELEDAYKILVQKRGKPTRRWKEDIKTGLKCMLLKGVDNILVAEDKSNGALL